MAALTSFRFWPSHLAALTSSLHTLGGPVLMSPAAYYVICRNGRQSEPDIARLIGWLKESAGKFQREVEIRYPQIAGVGSL
ncbi:hypothetical protein [Pseudomonas cyclaminis]|uniref:hypothetical protein n=1 Tax=Pseudomonas cyclaminis TaxID=2781239 RepID=UPI00382AB40A